MIKRITKLTYPTLFIIFISLGGCGGKSDGGNKDDTNADTQRKSVLTVSWQNNTDSDLAGYYVYHGASPSTLNDKYRVEKETTTYTYQVKQTDRTDHYFAISAVDNAGNESTHSEVLHVSDKITP